MSYFSFGENLKTPYREVFERAHIYASLKEMPKSDFDDSMLNLYDVLYTAQEEGKPVEKIVGQDLEQFCQDYFQPRQLENFITDLPERFLGLLRTFLYLGLFLIIGDFMASGRAQTINVTPFVGGVLISILMIPLSKLLYSLLIIKKKVSINRFYILLLALFILLIFGSAYLFDRLGIYDQLRLAVSPQMVIALSLLYLLPYHLYRLYQNYQKFGSFKNLDKEVDRLEMKKIDKEKYSQMEKKGILKYHYKKYQKMTQKGMTSNAIYDKWCQDLEKREKWEDKAHWLFYSLVWLVALIPVYLDSPFSEFLIYAAIQTTVVGFVGIKMTKYTKTARHKISQFLNQAKPHKENLGGYLEEQMKKVDP